MIVGWFPSNYVQAVEEAESTSPIDDYLKEQRRRTNTVSSKSSSKSMKLLLGGTLPENWECKIVDNKQIFVNLLTNETAKTMDEVQKLNVSFLKIHPLIEIKTSILNHFVNFNNGKLLCGLKR
jgi:hypothetical protein